MKELQEITQAWEALREQGQTAVLATVVRVDGSSYRRPGARMLIRFDGTTVGSVSGGCLEADVVERARRVRETGRPEVVTYDTTDDNDIVFGVGLGCQGIVRILVERLSPDDDAALTVAVRALAGGTAAVVATVYGADDAKIGERRLCLGGADDRSSWELEAQRALDAEASSSKTIEVDAGRREVFFEFIPPPRPLVIFGAGPDAPPLARLATEMGWRVTVVDSRPAFAAPTRFPGADAVLLSPRDALPPALRLDERSAAVIMTHNYRQDQALLAALLPSPVRYLGVLGPKRRTERLLAELREDGLTVTDAMLGRLYSPIGLDIGGETPEQIALAIIAEVQAVTAGRTGRFLRERRGAIYDHTGDRPEGVLTGERPPCPLSA